MKSFNIRNRFTIPIVIVPKRVILVMESITYIDIAALEDREEGIKWRIFNVTRYLARLDLDRIVLTINLFRNTEILMKKHPY
jgi:hypothetical protein